MGRNETLNFIRENSRCQQVINLKGSWTLEIRLTNDARSFILMDMGQDGFQIYWAEQHNSIEKTLEAFNKNLAGI